MGQPHAVQLLGLAIQHEGVERGQALLLAILHGHPHPLGGGRLEPTHQRQALCRPAANTVDDLAPHRGVVGEDK